MGKNNLQIKLFGGFQITCDGKPVPNMQSTRLQALIAYLVLQREIRHSRRYLAFTFWPDSNEKQALTNLRQTIHLFRQTFQDANSFLHADYREIYWKPDTPFSFDVSEFEELIKQSKKSGEKIGEESLATLYESAVELYQGDLFPECYDDWIESIRWDLKQEYISALQWLTEHFENTRNYKQAITYAEKLLTCDNLNENTYLRLIRLHSLNGDRANALRIYHQCEEILRQELGIDPGEMIRKLYDQIKENNITDIERSAEKKSGQVDLIPMVGRQQQWIRLRELWNQTTRGFSQLVIISGEAGIGKTRLAREMIQWTKNLNFAFATTRCYEAENPLAYAPISEWLRSKTIKQHLPDLDLVYLTQVSRLLPEILIENPNIPPPASMTDNWQRTFFFEAIARPVISSPNPILLFIDDLQWCDHETIDWIQFLIQFASDYPLFLLSTVRIEEVEDDHPLRLMVRALQRNDRVSEIELQPLSKQETDEIAVQMIGNSLDEDTKNRLLNESEGNPLFLIENIQAEMADGKNRGNKSQHISLLSNVQRGLLKDKVQNIIMSRLKMVSPEAQKIASYASVIGRNFSTEMLGQITEIKTEDLVSSLDELLTRRIFREQDERNLDFNHDKIREASYNSMNQVERSVIHGKIARVLVSNHQENPGPVSSQIAFHFDRAGNAEEAIYYYDQAASVAKQLFAFREAIQLLNRAVELLQELPGNNDRNRFELSIRLILGPLLMMVNGWHDPDVTKNDERIHQLSNRLEEPVSPPVIRSMAASNIMQAHYKGAYKLGEELLKLSEKEQESVLKVEGYYVTGVSSLFMGQFSRAKDHLKSAIDNFDPSNLQSHIHFYAQHPGVVCQIRLAQVLLYRGYPEQAKNWCQKAIDDAREYGHPFSLVYALYYSTFIKGELGDDETAMELSLEWVSICEDQDFRQVNKLV